MAMMASRARHRNCSNRELARQRVARKVDAAPITTGGNPSTRWHVLVVVPREDAESATLTNLGQPPQPPCLSRTRRVRYPWFHASIFSSRFSCVSEVVLAFFFNRFISGPLATSTHASANIEDALVVASWEDTEAVPCTLVRTLEEEGLEREPGSCDLQGALRPSSHDTSQLYPNLCSCPYWTTRRQVHRSRRRLT